MNRYLITLGLAALVSLGAMAATTIAPESSTTKYTGTGTNDNDVVIQTNDVQQYDTFILQSTAGAMDVVVSVDGTNYSTAPLSLSDLGAADQLPVLVTAANRTYGFRGKYKFIRVLQNGATGVENGVLRAGNM